VRALDPDLRAALRGLGAGDAARPRRAAADDRHLPPHGGGGGRGPMSLSWRRLRTLLVREMRATLRDPFTLGILVAAPIVALLAFGYTLSTEIKYLDLAVLDANDSAASRRLIGDLAAEETFTPHVVRSREEMTRMLVSGKVSAAVVIPPDFDRVLDEAGRGGPRRRCRRCTTAATRCSPATPRARSRRSSRPPAPPWSRARRRGRPASRS
jgi:hypothetical protein